METIYIQSTATGKIYMVLKSAGEKQLKSGQFVRVGAARVARISASLLERR